MSRVALLDPVLMDKLEQHQRELVEKGRELAHNLGSDKERQLRNILAIAEGSRSWALVELFMRYQAGRRQLNANWTEKAISELDGLKQLARSIAPDKQPEIVAELHLELVKRVLGYAIWWYVWQSAAQSKDRRERS
ncbi:MAG TPA: hypothetical protein VNL95_01550 [Dehalococcoidia bacterium]|nr:hypothetical protein [Dehalococcoidia bacterium]